MPFDRKRYPANWAEIRARILDRDGNRCKFCGVANGVDRITWKDGTELVSGDPDDGIEYETDLLDGEAKVARIVLTIAHLDNPDPMDVREENLAALCQRCHNRHDAPMRQANARATRLRKMGQLDLLEAA